MRIEIEIPKEFEEHFTQNKFKDSFGKIMEEIGRNLRSRYCSYAGRYEYETIEMLQKAFENSRQAYPVEKVVDELEEAKGNVPVNRLLDDIIKEKPKELGQLIAYDKAIEIVKQGGVADDVCKWEKGSSRYVGYPAYYSKCCATKSKELEIQTHIIADWKYCPYCGKKIKIVGD